MGFAHYRGPDPVSQQIYRRGYVDKLQFVNAQTLAYIDGLLADVPELKVMILHGDHGGGMLLHHSELEATCPKERFSPLLVVYSNDVRLQDAVPDDPNLVNLYRVVFNELFNAGLPLPPSRHFFASWSEPDRFEPVTAEQVNRQCREPVAAK